MTTTCPPERKRKMYRIYTETGFFAGAARTMKEALEMKARMEDAQRHSKFKTNRHRFTIIFVEKK